MLRLAPSHARFAAFFAPLLAALSLAPAAHAVDKKAEAEAKKAASDAMDTDYLANDLKKAKAKLQKAIERCGEDKCSPTTLATLHRDLGVVLATAKDSKGAATEFDAALAADPKGEVPKDYLSYAEVKKAWEAAKKRNGGGGGKSNGGKSSGGETSDSAGGVTVKFSTAPVGYEFPIVVTAPKGTATVKVSFKTDAMDKYHSVDAEKQGKVWVAIIPCAHTGAEGEIKYFVKALDDSGNEIDKKGSVKAPETISVVKTMPDGEETPTLPGDKEPKQCADQGDKKPEGAGCEGDDECQEGLVCKSGDEGKRCEAGERKSEKKKSSSGGASPTFFLGIDGQLEMLSISSTGNLCNQSGWACSVDQVNNPAYSGRTDVGPNSQVLLDNGGRTEGGTAWGTGRVMLTADYFVSPRFAIGARVGYAFNGNPTKTVAFKPIHAEATAKLFFSESSIRPFLGLGIGYGEIDGKVTGVIVRPTDPTLAAQDVTDVNGNPIIPNVNAWRTAGPVFASLGVGAWFFLTDHLAANVGIKGILPLQNMNLAIAPEAGLKYGF